MKILYVGDSDNTLLQRYARYFSDKGHSVSILHSGLQSYRVELNGELDGVNTIEPRKKKYSVKGLNFIKRILTTKKIIKAVSPDIIHLHSLTSYATSACFSNFHPMVFTPYGSDVLNAPFNSWRSSLLTKLSLRKIDAIIAQSNIMIGEVLKFSGPVDYTYNIHWGTDLAKFRTGIDSSELRIKLSIPDKSKVILSPRQLGFKYNIDVIINAIPLIIKEINNIMFVFKYYVTQGNLENEMKDLVKKLGVEQYVRFIGRNESPGASFESMPAFYNLSDICVSIPSWDGGSPSTLAEAFACGTFPILSNILTNTEWVLNEFNGLILDNIKPENLSKLIIRALNDDDLRTKTIKRNLDFVKQKGDFKIEMMKVESAYKEILERYAKHSNT